ncbi:serine hydrolase [Ornithinibacillus halotolerans]|uniref:Beta-lactamase class A catalytic domain-containing protein n=1 Tax=Ornithinibacillus halotolerans TaxID=1274357 RepID=A0A916W910_9BACI|nr:serine hydrolase [Ornithinibacillus halotolerans]GGA77196.1 hypothetical protein GCM10008025_21030 [Ornithinibacillus halotolerans]
MYPFLWLLFIGITVIYVFPIFIPKYRTKWNVIRAIVMTAAIILGILAIELLLFPPLMIMIILIIISFLTDKSTYTKKGMIVTGIIIALIIAGAYYLFHDDPDFVQKYIDNNPEFASMYVSVDGETVINKQGDVKRPLASTVKAVIAIEYVNQVVEGKIDPEEWVSLEKLDKFYLANTDGGAHPAWLDEMKSTKK